MKHTTITKEQAGEVDAVFPGTTATYGEKWNHVLVGDVGTIKGVRSIYLSTVSETSKSIGVRIDTETAIQYVATIMARLGITTITVDAPPPGIPVTYKEG